MNWIRICTETHTQRDIIFEQFYPRAKKPLKLLRKNQSKP